MYCAVFLIVYFVQYSELDRLIEWPYNKGNKTKGDDTMTKQKVIEAANKENKFFSGRGSYVNTDGEWCSTRTPKEFKTYLEKLGFEVLTCIETPYSKAIATTKEGISIAWNGFCTLMK